MSEDFSQHKMCIKILYNTCIYIWISSIGMQSSPKARRPERIAKYRCSAEEVEVVLDGKEELVISSH